MPGSFFSAPCTYTTKMNLAVNPRANTPKNAEHAPDAECDSAFICCSCAPECSSVIGGALDCSWTITKLLQTTNIIFWIKLLLLCFSAFILMMFYVKIKLLKKTHVTEGGRERRRERSAEVRTVEANMSSPWLMGVL